MRHNRSNPDLDRSVRIARSVVLRVDPTRRVSLVGAWATAPGPVDVLGGTR